MAANPRHDATMHDGYSRADGRTVADLAIAQDQDGWLSRSRIVLSPMAAPSIMGLFGFTIATVMLGAWQAGWYGTAATPLLIWPFAMVAGGVLQSIAAVASLRARDGVAVAVHTAWGSFWIGWGILQLLIATHVLPATPLGSVNQSMAFWFIALTLVTWFGMLGALRQNMGVLFTLGALTAGSAVTAAGFYAGSLVTLRVGGWIFVFSAAFAWLTAGAMVLEHSFGRTIIPLGKFGSPPGGHAPQETGPVGYQAGMPGVRVGQ